MIATKGNGAMTFLASCVGLAATALVVSGAGVREGAGSDWTRIGPWNIFDGTDPTKSASMGGFTCPPRPPPARHTQA